MDIYSNVVNIQSNAEGPFKQKHQAINVRTNEMFSMFYDDFSF